MAGGPAGDAKQHPASRSNATITQKQTHIPQFSTSSRRVVVRHTMAVIFVRHRRRLRRTSNAPPGASNRRWAGSGAGRLLWGRGEDWEKGRGRGARTTEKRPGQRSGAGKTSGWGAFSALRPLAPRPSPLLSNNSQFERLQHRPGPVADAEFGQDVGHVILYRALGDAERIGDFLVAVASGHQA